MGNKSRNRSGMSWAQLQASEPHRRHHVPPFSLKPRADRFVTEKELPQPRSPQGIPLAQINTTHAQPWQKTADKAKERALKKPPLGWNERRLAREQRKLDAAMGGDLAQVA